MHLFFFLLFATKSLSHPLGINDATLDDNFKCINESNLDKKINFGLKEYNFLEKDSKFLISIPFNNKLKKYSIPASAVYEFGTYTINNIVYDNMQMWFDHGYSGSNIYVFRRALVKKNNTYIDITPDINKSIKWKWFIIDSRITDKDIETIKMALNDSISDINVELKNTQSTRKKDVKDTREKMVTGSGTLILK